MAFFLLGVPGDVWAFCWLFWFRDFPSERAATSKETLRSVPIALLLRSKAMVKAMAQYFVGNFTFFICISWMFPYLVQRYSLTPGQAAKYSMVPLLSGATANWVSGFFVDLLYRSRFRPWSKRVPAAAGFLLAACGVYAVTFLDSLGLAISAFAIATFGVEMTISPSWAYCIDIARRNSGSASAAMNMAGSVGSVRERECLSAALSRNGKFGRLLLDCGRAQRARCGVLVEHGFDSEFPLCGAEWLALITDGTWTPSIPHNLLITRQLEWWRRGVGISRATENTQLIDFSRRQKR